MKKRKKKAVEEPIIITPMEAKVNELSDTLNQSEKDMHELYDRIVVCEDPKALEPEVKQTLRSYKTATTRLSKAYIRTNRLTDELATRWNEIGNKRKRRSPLRIPANGEVDHAERRLNHFASGINLYKLLLICFVGSFFGVLIEMLWCLLTIGTIESRAGLMYGPFNLLYGVGGVAVTAALYPLRNRRSALSFVGGMLVGSAVEYGCSWLQEMVFGSSSWNYEHLPFNINGRICLLYSVIWGILGVLWIKKIYPWFSSLLLKVPNRAGKIITWCLTAFLIVNALITMFAVMRWSQRIDGIEAANAFWAFFDTYFPDERMRSVFVHMQF